MDDSRLSHDALPERTVIELDSSPRFVVLFNPLEQERLSVVSLLVNSPRVRVLSEEGQPLSVQISAHWSSATNMVPDVYQVSVPIRLPALGLSTLQLQPDLDGPYTVPSSIRVYLNGVKLSVPRQTAFPLRVMDSSTSDFAISNHYMQVWFSGLTGLLKSIRRVDEEQEQQIDMKLLIYGTRTSKDKSGAYLFLPDSEAKPYVPKNSPVLRVTEGPFFSEVAAYYEHFHQVIRLYNLPGVEGLSLDMAILVDIRDYVNKELALRIHTDIDSQGTFFTDLNGFQLHLGTRRVTHRVEPTLAHQTVGPDFTSRLMVLRSNRRRKRLQVTLLSLSPWPRPRLSSCISRRSKITSSWPGEVNSELQFAKPRSKQTQALGADTPPQVLRGKGQ
ncbi:hypothetical protein NN561_020175 [Cricetulus griseus]